MKPPWEILGLEPGCSESDLRQAYARLLKEHRPDRDPEGFRLIRDAYEWMRSNNEFRKIVASQRDAEEVRPVEETAAVAEFQSDSTPISASPDISFQGVDIPQPVANQKSSLTDAGQPELVSPTLESARPGRTLIQRIERKLRLARREGDTDRERRILKKLLKMWRAKKTRDDAWDRLVLEQLKRNADALLTLMTFSDGITDVARDGTQVASALISEYARRAAWPSVLNMLEGLETCLKQNPSPSAVSVILLGASHIALLDWKRAQALVNAVYPHLSGSERNMELGDLDRMIQAGKEIALLSPKDRSVLAFSLANSAADPKDESVLLAIRNVSMMKSAATAKTLLGQQFPQFAARLKVKRTQPVRASSTSKSGSGFSGYWWIWVIIVALSRLGSHSYNNHESTPPPPLHYKLNDEQKRAIEDMMKKRKERESSNPGAPPRTLEEILNRGNPSVHPEKNPPAPAQDSKDPPASKLP